MVVAAATPVVAAAAAAAKVPRGQRRPKVVASKLSDGGDPGKISPHSDESLGVLSFRQSVVAESERRPPLSPHGHKSFSVPPF